jgi:membrane protein
MGLLRSRVMSFGLIVTMGFLLLVSLVVSAALAAVGTWWGAWFGGWVIALQIVNQLVSLLFVIALFAMMYRILPSVHVGWNDVWHGAIATGILFTIGKFAIGMYLGKAGVASGFGAAGSIIVLLVWVYYSSQIFLLGAEFTWLYAHNHGTRANQPAPKAPAADVARREPSPLPALPPAREPAGLLPEYPTPARDFATAAAVWVGFGLVRTLLSRFQKNKRAA